MSYERMRDLEVANAGLRQDIDDQAARIAALEAERDGYCSVATQAGREAAALRTERAELRRRLDEREGAEDRADEAMYALRAARADLEKAAVLLSVAMSAGMDGTREREAWRERRDALLVKHRSRSAPVSAAPTAPKPFEPCQRCACGRAPVISALGESRFRVWCEGCGEQRYADGESPDAAVSAWNKIAATPVPPAPEVPTPDEPKETP